MLCVVFRRPPLPPLVATLPPVTRHSGRRACQQAACRAPDSLYAPSTKSRNAGSSAVALTVLCMKMLLITSFKRVTFGQTGHTLLAEKLEADVNSVVFVRWHFRFWHFSQSGVTVVQTTDTHPHLTTLPYSTLACLFPPHLPLPGGLFPTKARVPQDLGGLGDSAALRGPSRANDHQQQGHKCCGPLEHDQSAAGSCGHRRVMRAPTGLHAPNSCTE